MAVTQVSPRVVSVFPSGHRRSLYSDMVKPMLDVAFALVLVIATLPLWLLIAVAIKFDSRGPVLLRQERVGMGGVRFRMFKFRSMCADAEQRLRELQSLNEAEGPVFKMRKDPRVTRIGGLLRRTSLDELPQLLNVLHGDMSLVGPRPALPAEVDEYSLADRVRLSVKPGITCIWQVSGRSDCPFEKWMEYDRDYVANLSAGLDLHILLRTVRVVLSCQGAY